MKTTQATFKKQSRVLMGSLALGTVAALVAPIAQAEFPEKRIEIIVPWSAGGSTDARARVLAPKFSELLNETVVVKNVAGAAGTIGTAQVARSRADGHTLLMTPSGPTAIQPQLRKLPYTLEDFDVVCRIDLVPMVMMASKESKYGTMDAFVQAARDNKGGMSYSTAGVGSMPHLVGLAVEQGFDIQLKHLPTKGAANAMKNMLGGVVDAAPETMDHISRFDVQGLAVASDERMPQFPDMPTFKELGVDIELANWQALYVPKGTPREAVDKLAAACETAFKDEDVAQKFANMNSLVNVLTGEAANTYAHEQTQAAKSLLSNAGLLAK